MSELSTVRCDRALSLWIAGTRASSVDGELPWRCCGRWTVRWTAVKGSRDRSSGLTEATDVDGVYGLAAGEEVTGVGRRLGPSEGRGGNGV